MKARRWIVVHPRDNVATAVERLQPSEVVETGDETHLRRLTLLGPVPFGHKFALTSISDGDTVVKYGEVIGRASRDISPGEHVHVHNVEGIKGRGDLHLAEGVRLGARVAPACAGGSEGQPPSSHEDRSQRAHTTGSAGEDTRAGERAEANGFMGYMRPDGRVGVRNHVLVFPTVVCAATTAQKISEAVPGTVYVGHPHGCGHLGADREHMIRTMIGFCTNPNVGAVLLVGLGCEQLSRDVLGPELGKAGQRFETLDIQEEGGAAAALARGVESARRLTRVVADDRRVRVDISRLVLGVKCGGSDTLSGLTANPALGAASDLLIAGGGTVIMTEIPEMIGAEEVLARRAADGDVCARLYQAITEMEDAILATGVDVRGTEPSPGNIEGGLSTLEEKSLGAILKGGTTPIRQVVAFAERPTARGLVVMDGPALDAVCVTGLLAAGAQVVVFTTGRGTPLGAAIAPVVKVASNSPLYRRMKDDLDLDAGKVLQGEATLAEMGREIMNEIIAVASGEVTRSEVHGHREFAIHSIGPAV